jgi:hypothetical protein
MNVAGSERVSRVIISSTAIGPTDQKKIDQILQINNLPS